MRVRALPAATFYPGTSATHSALPSFDRMTKKTKLELSFFLKCILEFITTLHNRIQIHHPYLNEVESAVGLDGVAEEEVLVPVVLPVAEHRLLLL